ncbi:MAG: imidazolonepropionase [Bryobacterales bacterium]|nr:imidazolonepropionase [Bryobacterales bacterium]
MSKNSPDSASKDQWTLIRRVRQLLTLHGPSGPRSGSALGELSIVNDGALLLHNGIIQDAGSARRVENLKQARNAREVDVGGRVVMPAFVDPDAVLVYPRPSAKPYPAGRSDADISRETRLRLVSKHRLSSTAVASAADWVRSGVLSVGAHTGYASDLRDTLRILRIHQTLQSKPLRIRSVYAPAMRSDGDDVTAELVETLISRALPAIRKRKLAAVIELSPEAEISGNARHMDAIRQVAIAAAGANYNIRIRTNIVPEQETLELTLGANSVTLLAPPLYSGASVRLLVQLARLGCVHVLPVTSAIREDWKSPGGARREIDEGMPVAIASGFRAGGVTSLNPQFLLHLAVERFGMTPEEAIVASTYNAACSLRMSHVTGSLEPGKSGDLLVMDVTDYRDLVHRVGHNDVQLAMRAGSVVYKRGPLMLD